jgi:hypothetical protein
MPAQIASSFLAFSSTPEVTITENISSLVTKHLEGAGYTRYVFSISVCGISGLFRLTEPIVALVRDPVRLLRWLLCLEILFYDDYGWAEDFYKPSDHDEFKSEW